MNASLRLHLLIFILTISSFATSQDLIITNLGDSINCKITHLKYERIYFIVSQNHQNISTFIPVEDVNYYSVGYYENVDIQPLYSKKDFNKPCLVDLSLTGGFSYRFARNLSELIVDDGFSVEIIKLPAGTYEMLSRIDAGIVVKLNIL